ncbi:MmcQ/YjbR family DNA-binding protein [Nocardiopsis algeriensis]|uniref:Putative DNA-binding protein (MmcQ/YjbR family) n=1 Tax=Nocardiopsis algeriensis TaxID=1478215 RepID=A0A841INI1_9ACTN|nr:MmcQ/YjbR family DNA-binding protein [Nocardiopsis algeriensis]MBB6118836.1 putative DNA-binding protein (MmcQ/YjbR family) [Nocardiopsis algeriensis]
MAPEQFIDAALWFPEAEESEPFGPGHLVHKIAGQKMFALLGGDREAAWVNLKCDPGLALELREEFPGVTPGYHMDKRHWNTVSLSEVPDDEILEMLRHSYVLVARGLRKADRDRVLAALGDGIPHLPGTGKPTGAV